MALDSASNNKRIAKNTILLYFRMFVMMAVGLFTSRVILDALGASDYGIYNVVGGVVTMFAFLNNCMTTSTQRFMTFELGKGNLQKLKNVFNFMKNGNTTHQIYKIYLNKCSEENLKL